ncbi:hypothetical protein GCM10027046_03700 [Uliginosibacterium flavum]|uniref:Uncharacterized protein n=1 Tax=Uliginosibacterium flavum TaxID=1396831 RepID=A0ABV2TLY8_9RHOO
MKFLAMFALILSCSSIAAPAQKEVTIDDFEGKSVVIRAATKSQTSSAISQVKQQLRTELFDSQSARYDTPDGVTIVELTDKSNGESFWVWIGLKVNAKNKFGAYSGYQRVCVMSTTRGVVRVVKLSGDSVTECDMLASSLVKYVK